MRKNIALLLILTFLFTLASCASTATTGSSPAGATKPAQLTKVRFLLDWTPNTNHTGVYVAKELGYFREAGLDVDIVQPTEGGALALVAAGKAEFGITFQEEIGAALTSSAPLPVKAIATVIQHNTSGIISLAEKNITRPRDMENHSYASWDTPIEKAILSAIAKEDGGSYDRIKIIPNTVTDVVAALQTDVDMVWIYYAWDGIATELAGLKTNFINFGKINPALDFYTPVIASSNDYLAKNPGAVKAFLDATAKGYEYAIKNPQEASAILVKNAQGLDAKLVEKSQEWLADQYKAEVTRWGVIDQKRWDTFFTWMYENELISKQIGAGEGFTNEFLP